MRVTGLFHVLVTNTLPDQPSLQLGLVAAGHGSVLGGAQQANSSTVVTPEVDEVDAAYRVFRDEGLPLRSAPRDEPRGPRHFLAIDPAGFAGDVVMRIEPAAEYAAAYIEVSRTETLLADGCLS